VSAIGYQLSALAYRLVAHRHPLSQGAPGLDESDPYGAARPVSYRLSAVAYRLVAISRPLGTAADTDSRTRSVSYRLSARLSAGCY
jgi:hypothetical protein